MTLESIHIYPVKGLKGYPVDRVYVERRGPRFDRRWMIVDRDGLFITQRGFPKMATIRARVERDSLVLSDFKTSLELPIEPRGQSLAVQVWKSCLEATLVHRDADVWLTEQLGDDCRLVIMPEESIRATDPVYSEPGDHVSFADGFPVLLANQNSLDDLNSRLESPIPMSRFRPSLVVSGALAWDEDHWTRVEIGGIRFRVVKPCGRCQVTTIDQETGTLTGDEPLRTLATFRKVGNSANFATNLIPDNEGWISAGSDVTVTM